MNTKEIMQARELNWKIYQKAIERLEKGYDAEAFEAFTMSLKNMVSFENLHEKSSEHHHHESYKNDNMAAMDAHQYHHADLVPNSTVDEGIHGMLDHYVEYSKAKDEFRAKKSEASKAEMLGHLKKMIMLHQEIAQQVVSCTDCEEERSMVREMMDKMKGLKHV